MQLLCFLEDLFKQNLFGDAPGDDNDDDDNE